MASMAMSATLATTFWRRTSVGTVPRIGRFGVVSTRLVAKSESWQHRADARPHLPGLAVRSTSAARSRRCRAARATRRSVSPRTRLAGDPDRATGRPRVALAHVGDELRAEAWGPGAGPGAGGRPGDCSALDDAPAADPGRPPARRATSPAAPRASGSRGLGRGPRIAGPGDPRAEGHRPGGTAGAGSGSIRVHGEAAPGPAEWRLRLPPTPATLAALPYYAYHPFGVERRRADLIRRVAARAAWFEAIVDLPLAEAYARLTAVPGIGPWTAAEVGVRALGDADAVSVGDFHLPNLVAYALAGEPRGTDDRMLELLEPYRGQRARVVRLLELSGLRAPRYGPRLSVQRIEDR